ALGQIVRLAAPPVGGQSGETSFRYGPAGELIEQRTPRGLFADPVIADPFIRHSFTNDPLTKIRTIVQGANTATPRRWWVRSNSDGQPEEIVDPAGRVTRIRYDERGLPLERTIYAGTVDERQFQFIYDRNGNHVRTVAPDEGEILYRYDIWD